MFFLAQSEPALSPLRVKSSGVRQSINFIIYIKQLNGLTHFVALHPSECALHYYFTLFKHQMILLVRGMG
jgi:hypothetical protein